jgi:hypothetical protein
VRSISALSVTEVSRFIDESTLEKLSHSVNGDSAEKTDAKNQFLFKVCESICNEIGASSFNLYYLSKDGLDLTQYQPNMENQLRIIHFAK